MFHSSIHAVCAVHCNHVATTYLVLLLSFHVCASGERLDVIGISGYSNQGVFNYTACVLFSYCMLLSNVKWC